MTTTVQRAEDRFATRTDWLDSHHSFSFGRHYDVSNTHFGLLLVNNDDIVTPGAGFETHPHRDMEIVTWVLRGRLVHQDSQGHNGVIYPGLAQRMSAGRGILHSEKNDAWRLTGGPEHDEPVRFVQMWVTPDEARHRPRLRAAGDRRRTARAAASSRWPPDVPSTWIRRRSGSTRRTRRCTRRGWLRARA